MDHVDTLILNYLFLVLNQLVIPVLGLSSLPALREVLQSRLVHPDEHTSVFQLLRGTMLSYPGIFTIKYLLNCLFLTNSNQMLQGPQHLCRWLTREREPWIFSWGYWYAYALAVLTSAILLGVLVPCVLPLAALFFALKYQVDKNNFQSNEFRLGPSLGGFLFVRIIFVVRMIVATMWLGVGAFVTFAFYDEGRGLRRCMFAGSLAVCGLWLWGSSSVKKYMNLHDSRYPTGIANTDRPNLTCGLDSFFQKIFGSFLADDEILPGASASVEFDEVGEPLRWDAKCGLKNCRSAVVHAQTPNNPSQAPALPTTEAYPHAVMAASQTASHGPTALAGPRTIPGTGLSGIRHRADV